MKTFAMVLAAVFASSAIADEPIRLLDQNPRYFTFRGAPTFLITSGEHYGAVLNRDFDTIPYLDELHARGLNLTRTFSGTYREIPGSFNIADNTLAPKRGRLASPWAQVQKDGEPEKFDLDRFDDAYFERLKSFVQDAGKRGIVVEYVLFCTIYDDGLWAANPMNAANNVNGVGKGKREDAFTLKDEELTKRQLAFVKKVVAELNAFDNVYYEICNEPYFAGVTLEWQAKVADTIVDTEKSLPHKHMIAQNIANEKAKIDAPHPAVSLFNFHYASPPTVLAMNAGLKKAVGDDETGFKGTGDHHYRREAWEFLLSGGSLYNNLDYSFTTAHPDGTAKVADPTPGGGGRAFRDQMGVLQRFLSRFSFATMTHQPELLKGSALAENARATVLAKPGQYAIYIDGGPKATLKLGVPDGDYSFSWIDTKTGKTLGEGAFSAGAILDSPEFSEDIALRVMRSSKQN